MPTTITVVGGAGSGVPPTIAMEEAAHHVTITVRSVQFIGGVEYSFLVTGDDPRERVAIVDRIPESFTDAAAVAAGGAGVGGGGGGGGADTGGGGGRGTGGGTGRGSNARAAIVIPRLVTDLQRAVTPFLNVDAPAQLGDGFMSLRINDPALKAGQARGEDLRAPWYVSPLLALDVSQAALLRVQGRLQIDANWSQPTYRVFGSTWGQLTYLESPGPREGDPPQTFGYVSDATDVVAAYVIADGLSVGVNTRFMQAPDQNFLNRFACYTGAEWVLEPLQLTQSSNVGLRYEIGAEHQEYVHLNVEKSFEGNFLRHRLVGFAQWHFPVVDLAASLAGASIVKDIRYSDVTASSTLSLRVLSDLSTSLTATASFRNALVNTPDNLNELDPLERFVGGGNFGNVNYALSLQLTYVIGNSLLQRQDQRWSNGPEP